MARSNVIHLPRRTVRAQAKAKVVKPRRAAKRKGISFPQRRQRELAWLLYISEGYIANVEHALRVNCVTFDNQDHEAVSWVLDTVKAAADKVRGRLRDIEGE